MSVTHVETPYLDAVVRHRENATGLFNVPAHKAGRYASPRLVEALGRAAVGLDTEPMIPGIDLGPSPTALASAQDLAADAWGAGRTWFIDAGGSGAVRAALLASRQLGARVLMQRNVHSSAIDGLILAGIRPTFVQPEIDHGLGAAHCVSPRALGQALEQAPDVDAVFLLSPTYYGTLANTRRLVKVAHDHGKPVIVDEAWGAHLAFSPRLPESALSAGADLVVSSTHKMAGALGQAAMLHLAPSPFGFDEGIVDRAVGAVESTSSSALLTASLDAARSWMAVEGEATISATLDALPGVHDDLRALGFEILDRGAIGAFAIAEIDPLRIAIDTRPTGLSGHAIGATLRDRGVFLELTAENVLVATLSPGEVADGIAPLLAALEDALAERQELAAASTARPSAVPIADAGSLTPTAAWFGPREAVALERSIGRMSADTLAVYPPGVPVVIPGEVLTAEIVAFLRAAIEADAFVRGAADRSLASVSVAAVQS